MRGVALAPGPHTVELRFRPDIRLLYVSLAAILLGLLLLGVLVALARSAAAGTPARHGKNQGPKLQAAR